MVATAVSDRLGYSSSGHLDGARLNAFATDWFTLLRDVGREDFSTRDHRVIAYQKSGKKFTFTLLQRKECSAHQVLNLSNIFKITHRILGYGRTPATREGCNGVADGLLQMVAATNNRHRQGVSGFMRALHSAGSNAESKEISKDSYVNQILWPPAHAMSPPDELESVAFGAYLIRHFVRSGAGVSAGEIGITDEILEPLATFLGTDKDTIRTWDRKEAREKYRKFALRNHPDKYPDRAAIFQQYNPIFQELLDKDLRQANPAHLSKALQKIGRFDSYAAAEVTPGVLACCVLPLFTCAVFWFSNRNAALSHAQVVVFPAMSLLGMGVLVILSQEKATRTHPNGQSYRTFKQAPVFRKFLRYVLPATLAGLHLVVIRRYYKQVGFRYLWGKDPSVQIMRTNYYLH